LNYLSDNKNINFFKFNKSEQLSIIEFSINYYALIYSLLLDNTALYTKLSNKCEKILKLLFFIYEIIQAINDTKNDINLNNIINMLNDLLQVINRFKINIDLEIAKILTIKQNELNIKFQEIFQEQGKQKNYQDEIPLNCDGLWVHPKYINYINNFYTFDKKDELKKILTMFDTLKNKSTMLYKLYNDIKLTDDTKKNIKNYKCWNNNNLTEKLDSTNFNNKIGNKIEELKQCSFKNGETLETIAKRYTTVKLKKNLDGYLDNSGDLINQNIVKNDYIFDIKDNCITAFKVNNSSSLLQRSNTILPGSSSKFTLPTDIPRTSSMPQVTSSPNASLPNASSASQQSPPIPPPRSSRLLQSSLLSKGGKNHKKTKKYINYNIE
jgi:hypothetical protein